MKRIYIGWLVILGVVGLSLLAARLSPQWRRANTLENRLARAAEESVKKGPPPDPGQGRITWNLPRAMRLDMPVLAVFNRHMHEHISGEEQLERQATEMAEHEMLAKFAAEYQGALAVIEVTESMAPASVTRRKITSFPTVVIYGAERRELPLPGNAGISAADHPEVWRHEGRATEEQIRAKLAELGIEPRERKPDTTARG